MDEFDRLKARFNQHLDPDWSSPVLAQYYADFLEKRVTELTKAAEIVEETPAVVSEVQPTESVDEKLVIAHVADQLKRLVAVASNEEAKYAIELAIDALKDVENE